MHSLPPAFIIGAPPPRGGSYTSFAPVVFCAIGCTAAIEFNIKLHPSVMAGGLMGGAGARTGGGGATEFVRIACRIGSSATK